MGLCLIITTNKHCSHVQSIHQDFERLSLKYEQSSGITRHFTGSKKQGNQYKRQKNEILQENGEEKSQVQGVCSKLKSNQSQLEQKTKNRNGHLMGERETEGLPKVSDHTEMSFTERV